jgi:PAS domain S-box-containing protein
LPEIISLIFRTMADTLHSTEQALHEREITFAALAKVAPVGIMRFDARGRCNYVNDRWSLISGLTIDEAIGDGWLRAVHPENRATIAVNWKKLRDENQTFREEYRICRPDGEVRWVMAEGVTLRDYSGKALGFIRAIADITTHRQLEAELSQARQELEERVRERTADLLAEMREREKLEKEVLSAKETEQRRFSQDLHDGLGQSLTGILFRALALQRDLEQSPRAAEAAKISELVNAAISQTHDLARGLQPVPLRPDGLVCALAELVQELCASHLAECIFDCPEPVSLEDNEAATHLYRIAQEALNNSLKHSGAGRITLRLKRRMQGCGLIVEDNGRGFRASATSKEGLGLNIMHHRARLIGASLKIRPARPAGTVVECVFNTGKMEELAAESV